MKKSQIIIIIAIIIAVIGLYFGLTNNKPTEEIKEDLIVVQSDDGLASLEIPQGALPAGVAEQDISVSLVVDPEIKDGVVMYELKPDGLELLKPVTFTLTQQGGAEGIIPILFHISGENFEIVDDTQVEIDLTIGITSISGDITSFSRIGTDITFNIFSYGVSSGGIGFIGDSFPFGISIQADSKKILNFRKDFTTRIKPGTKWSVTSFGVRSTTGRLAPIFIESPEQTMGISEFFDFISTHACAEKGTDALKNTKFISIKYNIERQWTYILDGKENIHTETKNTSTGIDFTYEGYTCKEAEEEIVVEQMAILCPMRIVVCPNSATSYSGYYDCDPITGEEYNEILLDYDTGEPFDIVCP